MSLLQQVIGDTTVEWFDQSPLSWTMSESLDINNQVRIERTHLVLNDLSDGYENKFLCEIKNCLINRRKRVSLSTVDTEYRMLKSILSKFQLRHPGTQRVSVIDFAFLRKLKDIQEDISADCLLRFKRFYKANHEATIYSSDISEADFPVKLSTKGQIGENVDRVLASALSRAACVEILRCSENAFEAGDIDIGCFSFINLAFHIYCRAASYHRITLSDLQIDIDPETQIKTYTLWVFPKKTGICQKSLKKIPYTIDKSVGELLEAQRINVVKKWGHLVSECDVGKIAMFPAKGVASDGNWAASTAQLYFGEPSHMNFFNGYLKPIFLIIDSIKFNLTDLRHTVGTQLAVAGCSATTIAAVLKHSSTDACQKYVDIAFEGLIDRLSEELEPGFDSHFPAYNLFRSKHDPVVSEKAINSIELSSGRRELTGECGKTNACEYAPIACYSCPRFTPCFDADHSINLQHVEAEINKFQQGGRPFYALVNQYKDARRYIMLVVAAANHLQNELKQS